MPGDRTLNYTPRAVEKVASFIFMKAFANAHRFLVRAAYSAQFCPSVRLSHPWTIVRQIDDLGWITLNSHMPQFTLYGVKPSHFWRIAWDLVKIDFYYQQDICIG